MPAQKAVPTQVRAAAASPEVAFIPYVVALGGTNRANSSTEQALRVALAAAAEAGARTSMLVGGDLNLPLYAPENRERTAEALRLIEELRRADGILIGSPGYHGGISGMVKNALDYTEDMNGGAHAYFDGRAVGCVATGGGWQGAVATMHALRDIVHALRGWNTPIGVAINTAEYPFVEGRCKSEPLNAQLESMGRQVVDFARMREQAARMTNTKEG